jgi:uncharacterized protein (DUF1697 family)
MRYVALLRGLNVGAHNRIKMPDLVTVFADAGCTALETFIQSGNVLFEANAALASELPTLVAAALEKDFGITSPVVLRDGKALAAVVKGNPFLRRGEDLATLHVGFLAAKPQAARVKALDPARSPPDEFEVKGQEIYVHAPHGLGRTKLTNAWFDAQLATVSTVRNWNTVLELAKRLTGA